MTCGRPEPPYSGAAVEPDPAALGEQAEGLAGSRPACVTAPSSQVAPARSPGAFSGATTSRQSWAAPASTSSYVSVSPSTSCSRKRTSSRIRFAERLPGHEHVLGAQQRRLPVQQRDDRGALQVVDVLLGHRRGRIGVAAGQHVRERAEHHLVVGQRAARQRVAGDAQLERGAAGRAGQAQVEPLGRRVAVGELQREGAGVAEQAVAVHRDAVGRRAGSRAPGPRRPSRRRWRGRSSRTPPAPAACGAVAARARPAAGRAAGSRPSRARCRRRPRAGRCTTRRAPGSHRSAAAPRSRRRAPCRRARRRRGTARTRRAAKASWPARMAPSRSSHEAVLASSSTPARLAPTLNWAPSLCSTSARGASAIVSASSCTMSPSMAFIFVWNSRQSDALADVPDRRRRRCRAPGGGPASGRRGAAHPAARGRTGRWPSIANGPARQA